MEYKAEPPPHLLPTVSSSLSALGLTANTMMFIKPILTLSLAALALAAPPTQPRQVNNLGGTSCPSLHPLVEA